MVLPRDCIALTHLERCKFDERLSSGVGRSVGTASNMFVCCAEKSNIRVELFLFEYVMARGLMPARNLCMIAERRSKLHRLNETWNRCHLSVRAADYCLAALANPSETPMHCATALWIDSTSTRCPHKLQPCRQSIGAGESSKPGGKTIMTTRLPILWTTNV